MRKFNKMEKIIIATTDVMKYNFFECSKHGLQALRNDVVNGECGFPSCTNKVTVVDISQSDYDSIVGGVVDEINKIK